MIAMVGYLKYNEKKFSNLDEISKPDINIMELFYHEQIDNQTKVFKLEGKNIFILRKF